MLFTWFGISCPCSSLKTPGLPAPWILDFFRPSRHQPLWVLAAHPPAPPPYPRRLAWIPRSELRHRGDFRSLKSGGEAISPCPISVARSTRRAGQGCRLFLSPIKSTCAAGVFVTTCCYVLGPGHGVARSTVTAVTRRGIPFSRLYCLVYYCLMCCLPPASCRRD